jgi:hypothetical protein
MTDRPGQDPGVFGGPEPDEEHSDLLGGPGPATDELGGPEPDEEHSDLLRGPEPG